MKIITRREFTRTSAGLLLAPSLLARRHAAAASPPRPNLLYLFADQLGYRHCAYAGNPLARTPNLDRLARQAISFQNAVSTMPVCCAYRATLMAGKYPTTTGMVINELRMNPNHRCIGHVLTENDYQTAYVGKWHLWASDQDPAIPVHTDRLNPCNSFVPRGPHRLGFDGYWAAHNFRHEYYDAFYHTESTEKLSYGDGVYEPDGQTDLMIRWLAEYASRKKSGQKQDQRPFAAFLSWGPPHDPWSDDNVPPSYLEPFKTVSFPNPPNYKPENDEPYTDAWGRIATDDRPLLEQWRRVYYAMNSNIDYNLGRLLTALDRLGLADNTVVVFTSDHGEMFGAHGRRNKNIFYEEAIRVPFLIRWPGRVKPASQSDACFAAVDIMPTLLGLLDLPVPDEVEGMNLAHLALGRTGPEPRAAFLQNTGACAAWRDGHEWRAVRDKRFTYAGYRVDGKELLFDNQQDPYQMNNLISDKSHADTANRLRTFMTEKMKDLNDTNESCTWYRRNFTNNHRAILRGAKG